MNNEKKITEARRARPKPEYLCLPQYELKEKLPTKQLCVAGPPALPKGIYRDNLMVSEIKTKFQHPQDQFNATTLSEHVSNLYLLSDILSCERTP